ncbi:unnamed protein product [Amoebophrya sp. A25]|nr:unnamed protein product [Amoebophrya sp. A25]|eukprot:GSA25T00024279001.1
MSIDGFISGSIRAAAWRYNLSDALLGGYDRVRLGEQLRREYKKQMLAHHPDKGGDAEEFLKAHADYQLLFDYFQQKEKEATSSKENDSVGAAEDNPGGAGGGIGKSFLDARFPKRSFFVAAKNDFNVNIPRMNTTSTGGGGVVTTSNGRTGTTSSMTSRPRRGYSTAQKINKTPASSSFVGEQQDASPANTTSSTARHRPDYTFESEGLGNLLGLGRAVGEVKPPSRRGEENPEPIVQTNRFEVKKSEKAEPKVQTKVEASPRPGLAPSPPIVQTKVEASPRPGLAPARIDRENAPEADKENASPTEDVSAGGVEQEKTLVEDDEDMVFKSAEDLFRPVITQLLQSRILGSNKAAKYADMLSRIGSGQETSTERRTDTSDAVAALTSHGTTNPVERTEQDRCPAKPNLKKDVNKVYPPLASRTLSKDSSGSSQGPDSSRDDSTSSSSGNSSGSSSCTRSSCSPSFDEEEDVNQVDYRTSKNYNASTTGTSSSTKLRNLKPGTKEPAHTTSSRESSCCEENEVLDPALSLRISPNVNLATHLQKYTTRPEDRTPQTTWIEVIASSSASSSSGSSSRNQSKGGWMARLKDAITDEEAESLSVDGVSTVKTRRDHARRKKNDVSDIFKPMGVEGNYLQSAGVDNVEIENVNELPPRYNSRNNRTTTRPRNPHIMVFPNQNGSSFDSSFFVPPGGRSSSASSASATGTESEEESPSKDVYRDAISSIVQNIHKNKNKLKS